MSKDHTRVFTCEHCKREFVNEWSEAEMDSEVKANFGDIADGDNVTVCNDCYIGFIEWLGNLTPERRAELYAEFRRGNAEQS